MAHFQSKEGLTSDTATISDLPDCIKQEILMYLPIKEAVRTCILSKSWRHTWSTIPDLVVDGSRNSNSHQNKRDDDDDSRIIGMFVEQLLSCHKDNNVRKFRYSGIRPCITNLVEWMRILSRKHISELILEIDPPEFKSLPYNFFSCLELKVLVLSSCGIMLPHEHEFNGFRLLHSLDLRNCIVLRGGITKLLSFCPLLQQLKLEPGSTNYVLKIHAPNLRELVICGYFSQLSLLTPKLCKLDFITSPNVRNATCVGLRGDVIRSSVIINHNLFGGSHGYFIQKNSPTFNNLNTMVVILKPSEDHADVIDMLSQAVPALRKLIAYFEPAKSSLVPSARKIRDQVFTCLREIDIITHHDSENVFGFAKFILNNAPVLQKLTIRSKKRDCEVLRELLKLSTTTEIIFDESCGDILIW